VEPVDSVKTWQGPSWRLVVTPGEDIRFYASGGVLAIDDQDVDMLCENILACSQDGALRSFESCVMPHEVTLPSYLQQEITNQSVLQIFTWADDKFLHIDAQYTAIKLSLPTSEAHEVAVALLEANDYSTVGPCRYCGVSVAEHPCNGC
jgi:hypothetical protein